MCQQWAHLCTVSTTVITDSLQCDPEGRPESDQQLLFINPDVSVEQIGDDPILMLENVMYVYTMNIIATFSPIACSVFQCDSDGAGQCLCCHQRH